MAMNLNNGLISLRRKRETARVRSLLCRIDLITALHLTLELFLIFKLSLSFKSIHEVGYCWGLKN